MSFDQDFKKKSYAIYGLGLTGHSTLNFLKKSGVKNFFLWDDNSKKRKNFNMKLLNPTCTKNDRKRQKYNQYCPGNLV